MGIGEKNWGRRDQENKPDRRRHRRGRRRRGGAPQQPSRRAAATWHHVSPPLGASDADGFGLSERSGRREGTGERRAPVVGRLGLGLKIEMDFFYLVGRKFRYAKAYQAHPLGKPLQSHYPDSECIEKKRVLHHEATHLDLGL